MTLKNKLQNSKDKFIKFGRQEKEKKYCPEHGCELESDGRCKGCSTSISNDDHNIFHEH